MKNKKALVALVLLLGMAGAVFFYWSSSGSPFLAGVSKSVEELTKIASGGDASALASLETMASAGDVNAQTNLADLLGGPQALYNGCCKVKRDPEKAIKWYRAAAEQGSQRAQLALISHYYWQEKNAKESYFWLVVSDTAAQPPPSWQREAYKDIYYPGLTKLLTPEERVAIEGVASEWKQSQESKENQKQKEPKGSE